MSKTANSLKREIAAREKRIVEHAAEGERMIADLAALKAAYAVLLKDEGLVVEAQAVSPPAAGDRRPYHRKQYQMKIGDAVEQILRAEGKRLHIMETGKRVGALIGAEPTRHSLTSVIRKDSKQRFHAYGEGYYGLVEWERQHEDSEAIRLAG